MDEKAEALWRFAQAAAERCRDRSKYEWLMNLAIWTAMTTATAWLLTDHTDFHRPDGVAWIGTGFAIALVILYARLWRSCLEKANVEDRRKGIYFSNRFLVRTKALGREEETLRWTTPKWCVDKHNRPLGSTDEGPAPLELEWWEVLGPRYGRWAPWFGISVTILVCLAFVLTLWFARSSPSAPEGATSAWLNELRVVSETRRVVGASVDMSGSGIVLRADLWDRVVSVLLVGGTVGLAIYTCRMWRATKRAAEASEAHGRAIKEDFRLRIRPSLAVNAVNPMPTLKIRNCTDTTARLCALYYGAGQKIGLDRAEVSRWPPYHGTEMALAEMMKALDPGGMGFVVYSDVAESPRWYARLFRLGGDGVTLCPLQTSGPFDSEEAATEAGFAEMSEAKQHATEGPSESAGSGGAE